jgi:hypothetical protein
MLSRSRSQIVSIAAAGRNTGLHHAYREECKRQSVEPGSHFSAVLSEEKHVRCHLQASNSVGVNN